MQHPWSGNRHHLLSHVYRYKSFYGGINAEQREGREKKKSVAHQKVVKDSAMLLQSTSITAVVEKYKQP